MHPPIVGTWESLTDIDSARPLIEREVIFVAEAADLRDNAHSIYVYENMRSANFI
jgi:hypothetical protein